MVKSYVAIAPLVGWLTLAIAPGPVAAQPPYTKPLLTPMAIEQQVQAVASLLEGVMDTSTQAASNTKAPNVRMTTCRVTLAAPELSKTTAPSIFLYQEQALSQKLSQPYRQRFLHIKPSSNGQQVESQSFRPANPKELIGLCNTPDRDRQISRTQLGSPVCSVFLKPLANRTGFMGETPQAGCPANYRGAVRITNQIELLPTGMNTWDRGFDAAGKQVWGAQSESYQFRRMPSAPTAHPAGSVITP